MHNLCGAMNFIIQYNCTMLKYTCIESPREYFFLFWDLQQRTYRFDNKIDESEKNRDRSILNSFINEILNFIQ